jgi:hypothetical protein
MKVESTYLNELYAAAIGITCSPMAFYMLLRLKLGLGDEQAEQFKAAYAESLKEPKTNAAQQADITVWAVLIVLVALGYVFGGWFFDFLAGVIGFSLAVEWMWRMEVGE